MYSKILNIKFPNSEVQKPLVCNLARNYDLVFNIFKAQIFPRKEGHMVLELSGTKENFKKGVDYLKAHGIQVENAIKDVKRHDDRCTHCGACTAVCPTGALTIERPEMKVVFNHEKCSLCELCVKACPPRAMVVRPLSDSFF